MTHPSYTNPSPPADQSGARSAEDVEPAIRESIMETRIVHLDWTQAREDELLALCDDSADHDDGGQEYWGTVSDDDDETDLPWGQWRVHLSRQIEGTPEG